MKERQYWGIVLAIFSVAHVFKPDNWFFTGVIFSSVLWIVVAWVREVFNDSEAS